MKTVPGFRVSKRKLRGLLQDGEKSAEAIRLVYVSDKEPGIKRAKRGKNFSYFKDGKRITDKNEIQRIKKLVIPPAWQNVWICCW